MKRITDEAVRLFIKSGYETTTVDEIASHAGISRRTFFHYFESKDDILLSMQSGMGDMLAAALLAEPLDQRPVDAVHNALIKVCAPYPAADLIALDRLMRSSAAVQARKQASYVQHEKTLFAALRERWPEPERETAFRMLAMLSIGAIRLSLDALSRDGGRRPLVELLDEAFDALAAEM